MTGPGPYSGAVITFATAHGKETLAQGPFASILGARVVAPQNLDTDQFGTFSGETPRTLSPRSAARAKAQLAVDSTGIACALASEGSFSSEFGFLFTHRELMLFVDRERNLELTESAAAVSSLPPRRSVDSLDDARHYADSAGFPAQGVIVRVGDLIHKELRGRAEFAGTVGPALAEGEVVSCEPDLRSHRCPSRAAVIAELARTMAQRLAAHCPSCDAPGYGRVDVERGARCRDCGSPTELVAADILGCGRCPHRERVARGTERIDPSQCPFCNP